MRVGLVDINGAYMQSVPILRVIFVRTPLEWDQGRRGSIWKLLKLPYGIMQAGRQRDTVIESGLIFTSAWKLLKEFHNYLLSGEEAAK